MRGGDFDGVAMYIATGKGPAAEEAIPGLGHINYLKFHPQYAGRSTQCVWRLAAAVCSGAVAAVVLP